MTSENKPKHIHLPETESTNSYLRNVLESEDLEEFSIVTSDFQTNGRGQADNKWESERKMNLIFSLLLKPTMLEAKDQFLLSQLVSLSIVEELSKYAQGFCIKWPNDIYYLDKKVGGILIENDIAGRYISHSIIGVGLNINQESFHSDAPNPVSLINIIGKKTEVFSLLQDILQTILSKYITIGLGGEFEIIKAYMNNMYRRKGYHSYKDEYGAFSAKTESIEPSGRLHLRLENGELRSYAFKEVTFIIS